MTPSPRMGFAAVAQLAERRFKQPWWTFESFQRLDGNISFKGPTQMTFRIENGWVIDERNNRANIEWFGGEAEAKEALESCSDCSDCYDCSGCSDCYDCSGCFGCSRCSDCSEMSPQKIEFPAIPVIENIHQKVYEAASQSGALCMREWHKCETTHCRAGWVVHLAGKPGYELEERTSTLFAAMQIYRASGFNISPVRFYDNDESAMADMKRLAGVN